MAEYNAPLNDIRFLLNDVFKCQEKWHSWPALKEQVDSDIAEAILEEGNKIAGGLLAPLNQSGDSQGVAWQDGQVVTPKGFKEAYQTIAEGGWLGITGNPEFGGMGMPKMLSVHFEEMLYGANNSLALYLVLTVGACLAIDSHADNKLKQQFLPKMYSGEWAGSMCLTEAHAGSDLGIIRTKAEPNADGTYSITGSKIFITGGEHDLTENIIHLVLAKLPDAPEGSRGISMFIVPKIWVNEDGSLGEFNQVNCGSVEHKMGIKASATCVLNFDDSRGFLVGEANKGLMYMFTMMNYERLSIGIQGIGCAEASYQIAANYAKDRLQGRSPEGVKYADKYADPLLVHPDVRRMLLNMKALTEGARIFSTYVALQLDTAKYSQDKTEQKKAKDFVALMTPVAKAFFTDMGLDACVLGQQVLGGHGYISEWGQEQLVRDVRIAQIYEGTNGIQALDLVARKVVANGGQYVDEFIAEIRDLIEQQQTDVMHEFLQPLQNAIVTLEKVTAWVIDKAKNNPNEIGAASVEYLHLFGYVALAYMWLKVVAVITQKSDQDNAFYDAKLKTARYYFNRLLPRIYGLEQCIMAGSEDLFSLEEKQF
ncbi:acyl-CoA dehydrogenase C-terminal domain-containing protein [Zooshikella sp. RANM57]|uniref:acyl-CoA dehydrogenase C-terminal domain-containing protein n=1 Tax=Zooshikella sp. RANM57 TaxID=3425863 RepID=UPI003D6FD777